MEKMVKLTLSLMLFGGTLGLLADQTGPTGPTGPTGLTGLTGAPVQEKQEKIDLDALGKKIGAWFEEMMAKPEVKEFKEKTKEGFETLKKKVQGIDVNELKEKAGAWFEEMKQKPEFKEMGTKLKSFAEGMKTKLGEAKEKWHKHKHERGDVKTDIERALMHLKLCTHKIMKHLSPVEQVAIKHMVLKHLKDMRVQLDARVAEFEAKLATMAEKLSAGDVAAIKESGLVHAIVEQLLGKAQEAEEEPVAEEEEPAE